MTSAGSVPHVRSLDGVRAVAAYSVIATHVGFNTGASLDDGPFAPVLARFDFGVTLFFLLSGFLLSRPFARAVLGVSAAPSVGGFWRRRFVRILPAYWVCVAVVLGLLSTRSANGGDWFSYLLLVQTYDSHNVDPSLTHMWTLAVEIAFYAALPLLMLAAGRMRRLAPVHRLLGLLVALAAVALAANLVARASGGDVAAGLLWLPAYLDWFALGMFLAVVSLLPPAGRRWVTGLRDVASAPGTCWAVGLLLFWLATLPLAGPRNLAPASAWEWTTKHYLYGAAAFFFLLPVMVGGAGWVTRLLGNRVMSWLGTISYGVYLWHLPLLIAIQRWLGWRTFGGHFAGLYLLTAAGATAAAAASWYLLERPLLRRFSRSWRAGARAGGDQDRRGERGQPEQLHAGGVRDRVR